MPDDGKGNSIISTFITTCLSTISVLITFKDLRPPFNSHTEYKSTFTISPIYLCSVCTLILQFSPQYTNIKKQSNKTTCLAQTFWSFKYFFLLLYFYFVNYLKHKFVKCMHFKYSTYFEHLHNIHTHSTSDQNS
jgi:amino acid permease